MQVQFILYVNNQKESTDFYSNLLEKKPILFVEGMTEFSINSQCKLGLMPIDGIVKLFPKKIKHPKGGKGIPRCELYIEVPSVKKIYNRAILLGATAISFPQYRDWGDFVGYVMDIDGHILAFYKHKPS